MAATIMRDDTVASISEEEHLLLPVVAIERPAMGEGDDRTGLVAPILVVQLNAVAECENGHDGCKGPAMEANEAISVISQSIEGSGAMECERDRKSTRLNSSHSQISYAVFCLKKKKHTIYL